jgi:hypothetical protein
MKIIWTVGLVLALAVGARAADQKKAEESIRQMVDALSDLATILSSVKDEVTADAALPRLKKAARQLRQLEKERRALHLSRQEEDRLREKYQKEIEAAVSKLQAAATQASSRAPTRAAALRAALRPARNSS